ncbi:MAG: two-component system sensor histidine kinase NtrB [Gemmatirosa sp.]
MSVSLLSTLVALAARQAEPDLVLPSALAELRSAHGLDATSVWIPGVSGPERRWAAGDLGSDEGAAARALFVDGARASAGASTAVALRLRGQLVGALVCSGEAASTAADALGPIVDLLAVLVGHAARAAELTAERDTRTAELDEQRRFAEGVVDSLPLGVYVIDRDYRVQLWNRKREVGTQGLAREAALGRSIFDVMTRQNAALMRQEFDEVFATGRMQQLQLESRSTGEPLTYRLSKIPMRDESGAVSHVITVGEDVTEWKAAMERTAQAEKLAAIGQLAAGVMHEINNPLATIAACAETMTLTLAELPRGQQAPPGFGEYLRIMDHEVHRCRGIAEGLLNFSRAKPLQRVALGLNAVVEQTLFLLKHHSRFKRCLVRLDLEDGTGPRVLCDPDQITQVAMALLLNAADAVDGISRGEDDMPAAVTLRTRGGVDGAVLEIEDEGTGIARDALPKIFEPFFTTKAPGSGTGLGLAICYGIVRDHGGRIAVDTEPGQGSTFRVVLPLAA